MLYHYVDIHDTTGFQTITAFDEIKQKLKLNGCDFATTPDELEVTIGKNKKIWGDYDKTAGRKLYHSLLPPKCLLESEAIPICQKARLASAVRHAAKIYVRRRTHFHLSLYVMAFDVFRNIQDGILPHGQSLSQTYEKYVRRAGSCDDPLPFTCEAACELMLKGSIKSNEAIDNLSGVRNVRNEL